MAIYSVYLRKENKKGLAPIYVGFYINREKIEVPVGISVAPDTFDKNKGVVRSSHEYAKDYNLIISDINYYGFIMYISSKEAKPTLVFMGLLVVSAI
jgi:hypothetical protein